MSALGIFPRMVGWIVACRITTPALMQRPCQLSCEAEGRVSAGRPLQRAKDNAFSARHKVTKNVSTDASACRWCIGFTALML